MDDEGGAILTIAGGGGEVGGVGDDRIIRRVTVYSGVDDEGHPITARNGHRLIQIRPIDIGGQGVGNADVGRVHPAVVGHDDGVGDGVAALRRVVGQLYCLGN